MRKSESIDKIAPAILKMQGALRGAIKDSANTFFKSKYADLESCWDALRAPLQDNGLAIVQTMSFVESMGPTIITILLHESGQFIEGEQPVMAKAASPQDLGSAITYARRYGLSAITGLIQVDDDAESSMKRGQQGGVPSLTPSQVEILLGRFARATGFPQATSIWTNEISPILDSLPEDTQKKFMETKEMIKGKFK